MITIMMTIIITIVNKKKLRDHTALGTQILHIKWANLKLFLKKMSFRIARTIETIRNIIMRIYTAFHFPYELMNEPVCGIGVNYEIVNRYEKRQFRLFV